MSGTDFFGLRSPTTGKNRLDTWVRSVLYWRLFDWRYEVVRVWENRLVWLVLKLIPGELKFWIMVQAAVKASNGGPPDSFGYKELHDEMVKGRWFR